MIRASRPRRGMLARRLCLLLAFCLAMALLSACPQDQAEHGGTDLEKAGAAILDRDIGDATMYLERYLRKNPAGEHRWTVWQQLLDIALDIRQDYRTAREYLELMLEEFSPDPPRRRRIQMQLAALADGMRDHERAVVLWEALSVDPETPPETLAVVYRQLSRAYLRRLEFTLSKEILDRCLQLNVEPSTKAECLFALADAHMLTQELGEAEDALRELLALKAASPQLQVLAVFVLADVLEQQERYEEARNLFESIRESYPNGKVIEVRLSALRNKPAARPAPKK